MFMKVPTKIEICVSVQVCVCVCVYPGIILSAKIVIQLAN